MSPPQPPHPIYLPPPQHIGAASFALFARSSSSCSPSSSPPSDSFFFFLPVPPPLPRPSPPPADSPPLGLPGPPAAAVLRGQAGGSLLPGGQAAVVQVAAGGGTWLLGDQTGRAGALPASGLRGAHLPPSACATERQCACHLYFFTAPSRRCCSFTNFLLFTCSLHTTVCLFVSLFVCFPFVCQPSCASVILSQRGKKKRVGGVRMERRHPAVAGARRLL